MFGDIGIRRVVNGPDGYTPDGHCLLGPVSGAPNFHVAAGFSIFGIVFAGGIGRQAAEWIVNGEPSRNVWPFTATRFGPYARSRHYVFDRASEVYEREYAVRFPFEELSAARPVRISPLYDSLAGKGAVFGERSGWERPLYFDRLPSTDSSRFVTAGASGSATSPTSAQRSTPASRLSTKRASPNLRCRDRSPEPRSTTSVPMLFPKKAISR